MHDYFNNVGGYSNGMPLLKRLLVLNGLKETKTKKSFKCRATLKQTRASKSKRAGMKTGLLFTSKCNYNYTKDNFQSQLLCWNQRNSWQKLQRVQINHTRMKISLKVRILTTQIKEKDNFVCFLHASASTTKRSITKATDMFLHEL